MKRTPVKIPLHRKQSPYEKQKKQQQQQQKQQNDNKFSPPESEKNMMINNNNSNGMHLRFNPYRKQQKARNQNDHNYKNIVTNHENHLGIRGDGNVVHINVHNDFHNPIK